MGILNPLRRFKRRYYIGPWYLVAMMAVEYAPYLTIAGALLPKPAGWLLYVPGILIWWLMCAWKGITLLLFLTIGRRLDAEQRRAFLRNSLPGMLVLGATVAGLVSGHLDWAAFALGAEAVVNVWQERGWRPRQALTVMAAMLLILAVTYVDGWIALAGLFAHLLSRLVREPLSRVVASKPGVEEYLEMQQKACEGGG